MKWACLKYRVYYLLLFFSYYLRLAVRVQVCGLAVFVQFDLALRSINDKDEQGNQKDGGCDPFFLLSFLLLSC